MDLASDRESTVLSASARERALTALAERELDVLIVGGGVVGAGVALDAVTRGLAVGLVEAQDFASGTSSRSTKLIHGGLRYLRMFDFALVREALHERGLLLETIAPHLVRRLPFLYPLRHRLFERAYAMFGIALYDGFARATRGSHGVARQRQLSRRALYAANPGLRHGRFVGAIEYQDAQVDDARLVLTLVRSAAGYGALAANRTIAVELAREGGRVCGARLRDLETGTEFVARSRTVILATGVWNEDLVASASGSDTSAVRPSKGVHITVAREKIALAGALVTNTATSVLFVIPWGRYWLIGTTDTPWAHDRAQPVANAHDLAYLLAQVNELLEVPLVPSDIEAVFAGLRPLIARANEETTRLSREHAIGTPEPGVVVVSGGKYTTYRVMAADAVDAAVRGLSAAAAPSRTASLALLGAGGPRDYAARDGLSSATFAHLYGRYGTLVDEVLAPVATDPALGQPLVSGADYLRAEVLYAVTHEGALHLEDVLRRRLRLEYESRARARACLEDVASIMAGALAWSEDECATELAHYRATLDAEERAEREPDDARASAVLASLGGESWPALEPR